MKYASGKNALGRCMRCGDKVKYRALHEDGQVKGLLVCASCRDIKHPQERLVNMVEGIALKRPSPDTDDDSAGHTGVPLAETLFPGQRYFGGET